MSLAISTSWNAFRHTGAEELILEIKALGFNEVELSFNLPGELVRGIASLAKEGSVKVRSLHNFCPIPEGVKRELALPDYYSLASLNAEERLRAVGQTKKTIDTAAALKAEAVVLHCGRVEIPDRTRNLIDLYNRGLRDSAEFQKLKADIIRERNSCFQPYLDNALKSLKELDQYSRQKNIRLGIETRFYYREIPDLKEIGIILDAFKGSQLFYWHDTGHAQLMENLGLARHEDFLDLYQDRLIGIHLHNISGCTDHRPPSQGEFDFRRLLPYIKKDTLKVVEAHHPATAEDLKASKELLEAVFDGKN
jgi:sugar phosphate isomerase/epimerase